MGTEATESVAPASTEEAAEVLTAAARDNLAVVVRGGGTKLDWGTPPRRLDLIVDTSRLTGVVEHAAGDLIMVVRAGTPSTPSTWVPSSSHSTIPCPVPPSAVRSRPTPADPGGCSTAPPATC